MDRILIESSKDYLGLRVRTSKYHDGRDTIEIMTFEVDGRTVEKIIFVPQEIPALIEALNDAVAELAGE